MQAKVKQQEAELRNKDSEIDAKKRVAKEIAEQISGKEDIIKQQDTII